ncbi:MAG: type II secretion system F family protein [Phycisphaerae bacterium]|nr:type II secretion system F family protein [Phycisphaerae bacterium]
MVEYSYKAVDSEGNTVAGVVDAANRKAAIGALSLQGRFVLDLAEAKGLMGKIYTAKIAQKSIFSLSGRIHSKDILAVTSQLSAALRAGLPLLEALKIIAAQQSRPKLKELLSNIAEEVSSGDSLSAVMAKRPAVFSRLYVSMIQAGETAGILEQTMQQLTELLSREEKIKTNMKTASVYPVSVLVAGLISVVFIVAFILPRVFDTLGAETVMPLPTRILIGISDFFRSYGLFLLVGFIGGWFCFRRWKQGEQGRLRWDWFVLHFPVLGSVIRSISVGRFARTLGALTKGGIGILESLAVVRDTLNNEVLGRSIDAVTEKVRTGHSLADPLKDSDLFPPLLVQIVSVGEHTGKLDEMLLNAADTFDEQADSAVQRLLALFPLFMILILAVVIFFIIMATLLPIMMMTMGEGLL